MLKNRGQITIYIIAGVIIIAVVALFVILFKTGILPNPLTPSVDKNPNSYLKECMQDKVSDTVKIIGPQGGTLKPVQSEELLFVEENRAYNISYLCYSSSNSVPCVNQNPMLISSMEKEIKDEILPEVNDCFDGLESSYRNAGYTVNVNGDDYGVSLHEGEVVIELDRTIKLTKADQSFVLKDFRIAIPSKIYDLALVAVEIVNKEATECNYDLFENSRIDMNFDVNEYKTKDGTKIYHIQDRNNPREIFNFAIKGGCS